MNIKPRNCFAIMALLSLMAQWRLPSMKPRRRLKNWAPILWWSRPKSMPAGAEIRLWKGGRLSAKGFFKLDGIKLRQGCDLGIADQAIAFTLMKGRP